MSDIKPITIEEAIAQHDELAEKTKARDLERTRLSQECTTKKLNEEITLRYFELEAADKPIRLDFADFRYEGDEEFIKEITNKYYHNGIVLIWNETWFTRNIDCYLVKNTARIEAKKQAENPPAKSWFKRLFGW